ncbi:unnamed protein product [Calypogeia fissa]
MGRTIGSCICTICTDEVDADTNCFQAIHPCGHVFHENCLKVWTQSGLANNCPTSCPVCNQSYETKDVLGLYFSDASRAEWPGIAAPQCLSDRYRARAQEYQKTILKLEADLRASEKKKLEVERHEEGYLEELRVVRAEVLKERKHNDRLANSFAKAQEELRASSAQCEGLLEREAVIAEILATTTMNMELGNAMSTVLSSSKGSVNKEDILCVLSKLLDKQKSAYFELMQKCRGLGMGEVQEVGKFMTQDEGTKAGTQGQIVTSEKEMTEGRYFIRRRNKPVGFSYADIAYKRPRPSPNDVDPCQAIISLPSCPLVDESKGSCRPSLSSVPPNVMS